MTIDLAALEREIDEWRETAGVPGLSAAVVRGADILWARGFGATEDAPAAAPVTPQTLFCIGSVTKLLTGTAVMRLVERGAAELDRPVIDYLPWLTFRLAGASGSITLRRLLSHTSGLPTVPLGPGRTEPQALVEFVREEVPRAAFVAPPGKLHFYSNLGLMLAGVVVEAVTRTPFATLMRELVFDPLAMSGTTFEGGAAARGSVALPHVRVRGSQGRPHAQDQAVENAAGNPAAFAFSSAADLANFAMMHLADGRFRGERFLSPESIREMRRPQADLYLPTGMTCGLTLFSSVYKGVPWVTHVGSLMSYVCEFSLFPSEDVAVVTLRNFGGDVMQWNIAGRMFDRFLGLPGRVDPPRFAPVSSEAWPGYIGDYASAVGGRATVQIAEDRLVMRRGRGSTALRALRQHVYFALQTGDTVAFLPEEAGPTQFVLINGVPLRRVGARTESRRGVAAAASAE